MKALHALPLVLLSLGAFAAPASAEDICFDNAQEQILEILDQFDFERVELIENSETWVRYEVQTGSHLFYVNVACNEVFSCQVAWDNPRGERRDTLAEVNEWNCSTWHTYAIVADDGRFMLFTSPHCCLDISNAEAVDIIETFISELETFRSQL